MRKAINLLCIRGKNILLVEKKGTWILPGGKPKKSDKNDQESTLRREVREELSGAEAINLKPYKNFTGITPHSKRSIEARCYFGEINVEEVKASAEISRADWFDSFDNIKLSSITADIIASLKADGYL